MSKEQEFINLCRKFCNHHISTTYQPSFLGYTVYHYDRMKNFIEVINITEDAVVNLPLADLQSFALHTINVLHGGEYNATRAIEVVQEQRVLTPNQAIEYIHQLGITI